MSAFDEFLADVQAARCWLAEIDAFILSPAADTTTDPSGAYAVPGYAEAAYGEGEPVQLIETLHFSSHGFISKTARSVGYLQLPGSPDHGKPATLGFEFLAGTLDPQFGDAAITFTRAGATATRVNAQGLIETVAADTPRFDHDPVTLACKGLLVEEARTNILPRSNELDHASWVKSAAGSGVVAAVVANDALGPDGAMSADRITLNRGAGDAVGDLSAISMDLAGTVVMGSSYGGSIYLKGTAGEKVAVRHAGRAPYTLHEFTGGWDRFSSIETAANNNGYFELADRGTLGTTRNVTFWAWGAQLEAGTFSTSIIPTVAAAVTRNAEVPVESDISGFYSAAEGTLFAEATFLQSDTGASRRVANFSDGTSNERITIETSTGGALRTVVQDGGASQASLTLANPIVVGTVYRVAQAYKTDDFASSANGGAAVTDNAGTLPTVDRLHLGTLGAGAQLNGHLRRFYYFPTRLADATLQSISGDGPSFELGEIAGGDADSRVWYDGRVRASEISVERRIFSRAGVGGLAVTKGEISLVNTDGGLDALLEEYAFDGRAFRLLIGPPAGARAEFGAVFSGVIEKATVGMEALRLALSDGIARLDVPVNAAVYPSGGLGEGADIIGKPRPRCWGAVFNVAPPLVEAAALIYQVNDGAISDVPQVYDRGVALVQGADYASQEDMETNAPAAGNYRVWKAGGFFRLGSTPAGTVSCDVLGDAGGAGYVDMTGEIVERVLGAAGIEAAFVDAASLAALNAAAPAPVGIWVGTESRTCGEAIEELLAGVGAFGGFSRLGLFTVGVIAAPGGASAAALTREHILALAREPLPEAVEPLVWRAYVAWQKNYTVQNDLAAAVPAARRAFAAEPARLAKADDSGLQSRRRLARVYGPTGNLYSEEADASAEAIRLMDLWGTARGMYRLSARELALARELGDVVDVTFPRFGFDAGRQARVLGHTIRGARVELMVLA